MSRRRARRAILSAVVAVVACQFALSVALERFKPEWRDPEFGHRLREFQRSPRTGKLVAVVGSSRAQMGLDPTAFDLPDKVTATNFAQSGSGPIQNLLTLCRLLDAGVRPDVLLVEVLPATLSDRSPVNRVTPSDRYDWRDLGHLAAYTDPPLHAAWLRSRLTPWSESRSVLISRAGWGFLLPTASRRDFLWKQTRPGGWMPYFFERVPADNREANLHRSHAEYAECLTGLHIDQLARQAHAELLQVATAHGIRVRFFVLPESPRFRSWADDATRETVSAYLAELGENCGRPVADLSGWGVNEDDFADGHHPLRHFATDTSRRFSREYVRGWVTAR